MKKNFWVKVGLFLSLGIMLGILSTFIPTYQGDGEFIDYGLFRITERYRVNFEEFPFQGEKIQKSYSFTGLPEIPMHLEIRFDPRSSNESRPESEFMPIFNLLEKHQVEVEVTLLKEKEKVIQIGKHSLVNNWVLSYWLFWHDDFVSVELSRDSEYTLNFSIEAQTVMSESVTVQLSLSSQYGLIF